MRGGRWRTRRGRDGVGGGRREGGGRGGDESGERVLRGGAFGLRSAAPVRSGGLVVGDSGVAGGVRVRMGWRRGMGDGDWFYDVRSVALREHAEINHIKAHTILMSSRLLS